ncbi:alpha-D-ribose 1-methylphosphonate 5-triphosphate synthase subunit PhnG [Ensifer mexicanus]|uniref:Phosphonate C-P lyase system protein PhnG n=2 Tax=Sinorhizobium mexicanum TaxID=375549 RepID=A0A859R099_9HYPH|nr:alpha-D-ribose 1-methylphosphonate 5-triphosphate synthase subunit PhnG [Sinorhizobium mexicanum]QLL64491.1 phosphonate C-P lyase system protein PhnG [Sinorhizobium mexicanum]
MAVLARTKCDDLERAWNDLPIAPQYEWLRRPETGLVLVRGRAGGTGGAFNLGEVTMTRCALRLTEGTTGFAFVLGRDQRHAELAAVFDALLQRADEVAAESRELVAQFEAMQARRRELKSRKAASTKVDFFAMARGTSPE